MRDVDTEEEDLVETFVEHGCGCELVLISPYAAGFLLQITIS